MPIELLARALTEALLNAWWQGALLAAVVAMAARRLNGGSPRVAHAVSWAVLLTTPGLVVFHLLAPARPTLNRALSAGEAAGASEAAAASGGFMTEAVPLPASLAEPLVIGVLLLALIGAVRALALARSIGTLRRLAATAVAPPPSLQHVVWNLVRDHGRRGVRVAMSEEIDAPCTIGFRRPLVLLPAGMPRDLSRTDLTRIVLHELAHVRRCDDVATLAQKLIERFFFYMPAVRWAARRVELTRELACDEFVVGVEGGRQAYAACLTRVAAAARKPGIALATAAVSGRSQLEARIRALLRSGGERRTGRAGALLAGSLVAALLGLIALSPTVFISAASPAVLTITASPLRVVGEPAGALAGAMEIVASPSPDEAAFSVQTSDPAADRIGSVPMPDPVPDVAVPCTACAPSLPRTEEVRVARRVERSRGRLQPQTPEAAEWSRSRPPVQLTIRRGPAAGAAPSAGRVLLPVVGRSPQIAPPGLPRWIRVEAMQPSGSVRGPLHPLR